MAATGSVQRGRRGARTRQRETGCRGSGTTGVESVTVSDRASDTRAPWVYCFWAAPAQSAVPACRKTSVSPYPAAEPPTAIDVGSPA
eukprot:scaffold65630_cov54-Phaeocystis_antarctica.AAC.2